MAEQQLNGADIGAGFEQMNGEGVPQAVRGNWLANREAEAGFLTGQFHGIPGDVPAPMSPGKSQCRGFSTRHQSRRISSSFGESIT